MKSIYIHCPLLPADSYHAVLEKLCLPPVRNVTVYTYADRVSEKQLDAFIEAQKAFGLAQPVRFRNILVRTGIPRFSWAVRRNVPWRSGVPAIWRWPWEFLRRWVIFSALLCLR